MLKIIGMNNKYLSGQKKKKIKTFRSVGISQL